MQAFVVRWIGLLLSGVWACQAPPPPIAADLYGARMVLADGSLVFDAEAPPRVRLATAHADLRLAVARADTAYPMDTQRDGLRLSATALTLSPGPIEVRLVDAAGQVRTRWAARWAVAPGAIPTIKRAAQAREGGDPQAALTVLQAADSDADLWVPVERARALAALGRSADAEAAWLDGAAKAHTRGVPSEASRRFLSAAHAAWARRDWPAMQTRLAAAEAIDQDTLTHRCSLLHLQGVLAMETGAWQAALRRFETAVEMAERWGFATHRHAVVESQALLLEVLGQPEAALQRLRASRPPPAASPAVRARFALNEGWLMMQAGVAGAASRFRTALAAGGPPAFQATARLNLAWAHHQAGDIEAARTELAQVQRFHGGVVPPAVRLLDGELALHAGAFRQARSAFEALQGQSDPEVRWRAFFGQGRTLEAQGETDAALAALQQGLAALARAATQAPLRQDRSAFLDRRHALVDATARLLLRANRPAEALRVVDQAHSRVLRDLQTRARLNALPDRGPWLTRLGRIEQARQRRHVLEGRQDLVAGAAADRWAVDLRIARAAEAAAIDAALGWLDSQTSTARPAPCDLPSHLKPGQLVMAFARIAGQRLVFHITAEGVMARPAGASPSLDGITRVWIVPGGDPKAFTVETGERPVGYLPHAEALCASAEAGRGAPLLIVDPDRTLPAARREGRTLAARWPDATTLDGASASRGAVLQALPHAGMVHFSGHGILHRQRPWDAFLKLADGTRLGLLDVLLTPLDGPLVFLNGCRTGDEAVFLRSDVPGLPEAFLAAGARAVIASIRDVPDAAAARFSRVFYEEGGRVDPMAALHRTQARLRAEGHPAWDAYRLYGR